MRTPNSICQAPFAVGWPTRRSWAWPQGSKLRSPMVAAIRSWSGWSLPCAARRIRRAPLPCQENSSAEPRACQAVSWPKRDRRRSPRNSKERTWMRPNPLSAQSLPNRAWALMSAPPSGLPAQRKAIVAPPERSAAPRTCSAWEKACATSLERGTGFSVGGDFAGSLSKDTGNSPSALSVSFPARIWNDRRMSQRPSWAISATTASVRAWRCPSSATDAGHQRRAPFRRSRVGSICPTMSWPELSASSSRVAVKISPVSPSRPTVRSSAAMVRSGIIQRLRVCRRIPSRARRWTIMSAAKSGICTA